MLPGCLQSDQYGWCSKSNGCPPGQTYIAGVCCIETVENRDFSTFPGKCKKCDITCRTCSGINSTDCLSCPTFSGRKLNGSICQSCTSSNCLSCDTGPSVCDAFFTPLTCPDRCLDCISDIVCNTGGCEPGYNRDWDGKCLICGGGCASCN